MASVDERFWQKVEQRGPNDCWPWTAFINEHGYGQFYDGNRLVRSHRYAYGDAPIGADIDHTCHNGSGCTDVPCEHRKCCNPRHLEAVTRRVNANRGRCGAHQTAKTHCPHGHEYSPSNTILRNGGKHRVCRTCNRNHQRNYNQRKKMHHGK